MLNLGSIPAGKTVCFMFATHQADGTPATLGGTPAVSVYSDDSAVQTTVGVTLTVDFDATTGLNHVTIDTADAFYSNGHEYTAVITQGTVDGVSVRGTPVAHFSIDDSLSTAVAKINALNPLTAIRVNTPVAASGDISIIIGQDHLQSNAQDLAFSSLSGPDMTGGSVVYEIFSQEKTLLKSAVGIVLGAHSVTCEIPKAESALLRPGLGTFRVMGTESAGNGGETTELLVGRCTIKY
jgi:hypothetical protein